MGSKGCLEISSSSSRLLFQSLLLRLINQLHLSCSSLRFELLNGSTDRKRWYKHVSWEATSLDEDRGDQRDGKMIKKLDRTRAEMSNSLN